MNRAAFDALFRPAFFAVFFLLVCILGAFSAALLIQIRRTRRIRALQAEGAPVRRQLDTAVVQFLAGSPDDSTIRELLKTHRADVARTLLRFQRTVAGGARDRLCLLALDLGLVHEWCLDAASSDLMTRRTAFERLAFVCTYEPCRRIAGEFLSRALENPDEQIRLSASRGLVQTGIKSDVENVFLVALAPNQLIRAVLAEDLRRYAMMLCADAVPEILASDRPDYVRATLEILNAWERAIPVPDLRPFLDHGDRTIRILALRLAPLTSPDERSRAAILRARRDDDLEIRSLAEAAVARLKLDEGSPA